MSYFLLEELPAYDPALLVGKKTEPAQVAGRAPGGGRSRCRAWI